VEDTVWSAEEKLTIRERRRIGRAIELIKENDIVTKQKKAIGSLA
jgi:hypothetical protein